MSFSSPEVEETATPTLRNAASTGFNFNATPDGNNLNTTFERTPELQGFLDQFGSVSGAASNELQGLQGLVKPGVSQLRTSQLNRLEDARTKAIGNLRDNVARRKVTGSSFSNDALARAEAEFGRAGADIEAQSTLQELALTDQLISKRLAVDLQPIQTFINQINSESGLFAGLTGQAQEAALGAANITADAAKLNAKLEAQTQATIGKGIGTLAAAGATVASGGTAFPLLLGQLAGDFTDDPE